jgi:hypothetical protein
MSRDRTYLHQDANPVAALVAIGLLFFALAGTTTADGGVALDLAEVAVEDVLDPGRRYELPVLTVRNPGDEHSTYRMGAGGIENDDFLDPVEEWFEFDPDNFALAGKASSPVSVSLVLPQDAAAGDYRGVVRAELVPEGEGPLVGVAAGAEITFTLSQRGDLGAIFRWLEDAFRDLLPWSVILPLVVIAVIAAVWLRKRFRISIEAR